MLIQRRNNVVCPVGSRYYHLYFPFKQWNLKDKGSIKFGRLANAMDQIVHNNVRNFRPLEVVGHVKIYIL